MPPGPAEANGRTAACNCSLHRRGMPRHPPLHIAIVGLGRIGWDFHFLGCVASPLFTVVAVVDPVEERREEAVAAAEGCSAFASLEELWENSAASGRRVDVITIATPTRMHEQMTIASLRRGCHVVLEKPMTTDVASADRMIACAEIEGRQIFSYQPHRWVAETEAIQRIVAMGVLGPIFSIRRSYHAYVRRNDWQSLTKNGGGMLYNYGAHFMDQLLYLSDGSPVCAVECHLFAAATRGDADDAVFARVRLESGQLLDLDINTAAALPPGSNGATFHICGQHGTAVSGDNCFHLKYYVPATAPKLPVETGLAAPGRSYTPGDHTLDWREETLQFVSDEKLPDFYANVHSVVVGDGVQAAPLVKMEETRELMRVLEECRQTAMRPSLNRPGGIGRVGPKL